MVQIFKQKHYLDVAIPTTEARVVTVMYYETNSQYLVNESKPPKISPINLLLFAVGSASNFGLLT